MLRILGFVSLGLFIAILIESLNWTHAMAKAAAPLVRIGRLQDISGAAFSMAFFSGVAANTMLAENYDQGKLTKRELIFSNLFNSLPTYFLHMPTLFFVTLPFLGGAAVVYVGLTFLSALLRTASIVIMGRLFLPPLPEGCVVCRLDEQKSLTWAETLRKAWRQFTKRIKRIIIFTTPIYAGIFFLNREGFFTWLQESVFSQIELSFLPAKAMSIVVFYVAAEATAGLAAAGAMLDAGDLAAKDVIMALLVGNILSSPMRAFRHQFPYYAGIFSPRTAMNLIIYNQTLRAASVALVAAGFYMAV